VADIVMLVTVYVDIACLDLYWCISVQ